MIVVVGLSHRTAPVELREALAFQRTEAAKILSRLRGETPLSEAMLLSTCNRVEVYGRASDAGAVEAVAEVMKALRPEWAERVDAALYRLEGEAAVRHAFRVAASLDSMVLGEPQILGQVKEAYEIAQEAGTLGGVLNALRARSVASAKRARTETGIGHNAVSISYVAVELARKIFGQLEAKGVLLVGAGKMSELAAKHLVHGGARAVVLGGRHFARAEELAAALGGRAAPFEALREELARADIVISSTGAPGTVIHVADVEAAMSARRGRPLFLIDIAVPRDIESAVASLSGVFLYDMDDLKSVAEANLRERRKEAAAAEAIVEKEVREFLMWRRSLEAVPLVVDLRRRAEEVRRGEIAKARGRLGQLTPEQEQAIEQLTSAIVSKLLHPPTAHIKEAAATEGHIEHVGLIRKLLGL